MEQIEPQRKKPGPQAKPKIESADLLKRIEGLESLLVRIAHNSGTAHSLIIKAGLKPYSPTKADMSKFDKAG
jgi:hypothetical protein